MEHKTEIIAELYQQPVSEGTMAVTAAKPAHGLALVVGQCVALFQSRKPGLIG